MLLGVPLSIGGKLSNGDPKKQHKIKTTPDRQATLALYREKIPSASSESDEELEMQFDLLKKKGLSERELQEYIVELSVSKGEAREPGLPEVDVKNQTVPATPIPDLPPSQAPNTQPEGAPTQLAQNPSANLGQGGGNPEIHEIVAAGLRAAAQETYGKTLGELTREELTALIESLKGDSGGQAAPV